jgi:hypothetical protein
MPHRGADFHWGGALFVEGHPEKPFWFFHCLNLSISWSAGSQWKSMTDCIRASAKRTRIEFDANAAERIFDRLHE